LRIEQGQATVVMGPSKEQLQTWQASDGFAVFVPSGSWHNLTNTGADTLKVYSIYAPPQHPHGTVHVTKEDADKSE
jgi:mannose-6-phosphate isomerase-like protein (cupin superfamily)